MSGGSKEAAAASAAQRLSDRIHYSYRLRITGKDSDGICFDEAARTEVVTRDGALLVTELSLSTGSVITVSRGPKSAEARVVGQCGLRNEQFLYGTQFLHPLSEPFWDVHFPPPPPESSAGKMVLQCSRCSRQEVALVTEVEMIVYETVRVIPRPCSECRLETLWVEPTLLGENDVVSGNQAYNLDLTPVSRIVRSVNDRKHSRVQMRNIKACLRRPGHSDDVVAVTNLSRGGIGFMSYVDYIPRTELEVAVPYTQGGANVFTRGKIVRVRCRPSADIPGEFGLSYLKK